MKVAWHLLFLFQACPSYRLWLQLVLGHQNTEWRAVMATLHSKHVNLPFFIPAPNSSFLVKECLGFTASFLLPPVVGCRLKMESSGHLWLLCLLLLWWVYCETISVYEWMPFLSTKYVAVLMQRSIYLKPRRLKTSINDHFFSRSFSSKADGLPVVGPSRQTPNSFSYSKCTCATRTSSVPAYDTRA